MQAPQIRSLETISATTAVKMSGLARSSMVSEGFSLKLRRNILASHTDTPAAGFVSAKVPSGIQQGGAAALLSGNPGTPGPSSTEKSSSVNQPTPIQNLPTAATPGTDPFHVGPDIAELPGIQDPAKIAMITKTDSEIVPASPMTVGPAAIPATREKTGLLPEAIVRATPVSVIRAGSAGVKRAAKANSTTSPAEVSFVQGSPLAGPVVTTSIAVQVKDSADTRQAKAQQTPTNQDPSATASLSPTRGPSLLSTGTAMDDLGFAAQTPAGRQSLTSGLERHVSPATAPLSKSQHVAISAAIATGAGGIVVAASTAVASGSAFANQAATLIAGMQTAALDRSKLPAGRADLQPHGAATLDTTGIREVHVLASAPTQLDVGVLDGTHGWLRIRAEMGAAGRVTASVTASPLAHESLNAALPEMAKYLGSESVSVTKLVVHSFSQGSDKMTLGTEANQQNGTAHERTPPRENAIGGGDAQKRESQSSSEHEPTTTSSPTPPASGAPSSFTDQPIAELAHGALLSQWSLGGLEGSRGNWLNVCA